MLEELTLGRHGDGCIYTLLMINRLPQPTFRTEFKLVFVRTWNTRTPLCAAARLSLVLSRSLAGWSRMPYISNLHAASNRCLSDTAGVWPLHTHTHSFVLFTETCCVFLRLWRWCTSPGVWRGCFKNTEVSIWPMHVCCHKAVFVCVCKLTHVYGGTPWFCPSGPSDHWCSWCLEDVVCIEFPQNHQSQLEKHTQNDGDQKHRKWKTVNVAMATVLSFCSHS